MSFPAGLQILQPYLTFRDADPRVRQEAASIIEAAPRVHESGIARFALNGSQPSPCVRVQRQQQGSTTEILDLEGHPSALIDRREYIGAGAFGQSFERVIKNFTSGFGDFQSPQVDALLEPRGENHPFRCPCGRQRIWRWSDGIVDDRPV
jgi:hypothetical protein